MASLFEIPIEKVGGIGEKRGLLYRKLGIDTVGALIRFYPRSYEDWSSPTAIANAEVGTNVCIKAVISTAAAEHRVAGGKLLVTSRATDGNGFMRIVFFNNKYIRQKLILGEEFIFFGRLTENNGIKEMINPALEKFSTASKVRPIYGQTLGLTSRMIEKSVSKAITMLPDEMRDPIPLNIREKYNIITLKQALVQIHCPESLAEVNEARKRLIFEELLIL
ncbi:MAG: ATP-dependent DNA helicase RecG, partial [Lachnospiraceae bacterium]|nr:ATP-dependent DNA helicase RecG [Lachnospiraceae bacterium]